MRRWTVAALLLLLSATAQAQGTPDTTPTACRFPDDLAMSGMSLPAVRAAITARRVLTILTIGGSSTAGLAAQGSEFTYPARLAEHLRHRLPGMEINVVNRGLAASPTRARVDRLATDLAQTHPDLVIWAPGSSEAGMSEDPGGFIDSLQEGVEKIRTAHADLILIDLQYAPSIARVVNLSDYNNAIAGVARAEDVPLLRRSELMRRWNDDGSFALDTTPPSQRVPVIRRLFDCIALGLADGIVGAGR